MKKIISSEAAPRAIGPYSQAVVVNGMAYLSGQIPIDPSTNQLIEAVLSSRPNASSKT